MKLTSEKHFSKSIKILHENLNGKDYLENLDIDEA
jgi:hypothetical protein